MIKVRLRAAYAFDCEECGRENFINGLVFDPTEEEAAELREEHGIQPWETGEWMDAPNEVECEHCGTRFATDRDAPD